MIKVEDSELQVELKKFDSSLAQEQAAQESLDKANRRNQYSKTYRRNQYSKTEGPKDMPLTTQTPTEFVKSEEELTRPKFYEAGWTEYVMTLFLPDERYVPENAGKECITLGGLRRVAHQLCMITNEMSMVVTGTGVPAMVVQYQVNYTWRTTSASGLTTEPKMVVAVGEANSKNCAKEPFASYLFHIAENRAEARALKKLLGLKNVLSWDEVSGQDGVLMNELEGPETSKNLDTEDDDAVQISPVQKSTIDTLGKRYNINVWAFLNSGTKQYLTVDDITKAAASKMIQELNKFKDAKPEAALQGYDKNWQSQ